MHKPHITRSKETYVTGMIALYRQKFLYVQKGEKKGPCQSAAASA